MIDKIKRFDAKSEKNKKIVYYIVYTAMFLVMISLVCLQFGKNDKSFVRNGDGLEQHFPVITYFAKILRQSISSVFSGGGLQLPLWDFAIGPGSDIVTTLNYYGVGDPLNLLVVLFPLDKMEMGYAFLILLRTYLSGVTFSMYCKEMRRGRWNTLCGALAYAFCGYAIYAGVRHPFFINPMIILPLLLLGIEKIFKNKKPYVFILAVFYAAITGIYFFYMLGILSVIYVLIRGWSFCGKSQTKSLPVYMCKFAGYFIVGILLSSITFVPNTIALLGSTRMKTDMDIRMFFKPEYYLYAPIKFLAGSSVGYWTQLGYVALIAVAIFMMFSYRRKYTQLKVCFIILTIMLCVPYAGYVMNGFSYVSNRWIWGYGFLLGFIMTTMLPEMVNIGKKRFIALLFASFAYLSYLYWFSFNEKMSDKIRELSKLAGIQYLITIGVLIIAFSWRCVVRKSETRTRTQVCNIIIKCLLLITVIVNTLLQANWYYSPQGGNYVAEFCAMNMAYNRQTEVANIVQLINDAGEFYRYSENAYDKGQLDNNALISQMHSNSLYYSLVDVNYIKYLNGVACNDVINAGRVNGLDARTVLNTLAATKYYVSEASKENYVPYGYKRLFDNGRFNAYKNENYLPLGYTYPNYISSIKYDLLDPLEKEQTMLKAVVLDEKTKGLSELVAESTSQKCDFKLEVQEGVIFEQGKFKVNKKGTKVIISMEGLPNSETYLMMSNLKYQAPKGKEEEIARTIIEVYDNGKKEAANEQIVRKIFDVRTSYHQWRVDRDDFVVNMGYALHAKNKLTIKFSQKGEYTFDEMSIICQPMDNYAEQINKLKEDVLENVVIGTNKVNGTIDLEDTKFLCMSIPYSKGWNIYINGEQRKLLRANTAYMGVELEAGHHEIELRYFTPYLKISIVCTIVGMMLFAGIVIADKRKGIRKGKNRE